jgi:hypothetical protein
MKIEKVCFIAEILSTKTGRLFGWACIRDKSYIITSVKEQSANKLYKTPVF